MYCQKCGARLEEDSSFCAHCGQQVAEAAAINSDGGNVQTFCTKKKPRPANQILATIGIVLLLCAAMVFIEESNSYYRMSADMVAVIVCMFIMGAYSLILGIIGLVQTPKLYITILRDRVKGKTTINGIIPTLMDFEVPIADIEDVQQLFGTVLIQGKKKNIGLPYMEDAEKIVEIIKNNKKEFQETGKIVA